MTHEEILNRVQSLTSCSVEDIEEAMAQAGADDGDERDFDTIVEDVMNCLGF